MRGKQPFDSGNNTLVITHLFGKDSEAYWKSFDWNRAIKAAMQSAGAEYMGEYGWLKTTMHWPLSHMVAPKEEALGCVNCHSKDGRLDKLTGFYLPGRDKSDLLDSIGWIAVFGTLGGLSIHGLGRLVFRKRRNS